MSFLRSDRASLWVSLALACINGLLYLFIVPPWQHYDEPGHFEFAWLIAHRPALPQPGDVDSVMRREVATSMITHGFYLGTGQPSDLLETEPINIGLSQVDSYPVYYWLAALPLRLLSAVDITQQLYAARAVSLCLFLVSIVACWGTLRELTHPHSALRWLMPICLALLPAYADIMTAVNNDAAAVAFATLLIWGMVRLIQRDFSLGGLIWCGVWSVVCYWTKTATYPVIAALAMALPLSLLKQRGRMVVWAALGLAIVFAFLASTQWDDARGWLRFGGQESGVRRATNQAQTGYYAFALDPAVGTYMQIQQVVSADIVKALHGQTATLGAWVWSESAQSQTGYTPVLIIETTFASSIYKTIQLTPQPTFHSFTATIPLDAQRIWLALYKPNNAISSAIFYDDVVFAPGEFDAASQPALYEANLIQNSSAENGVARIKTNWQHFLTQNPAFNPNHFLGIVLDPNTLRSYVESIMNLSLQTFWARFAWGHVTLNTLALYPLLNALLITSVLCSAYGLTFGPGRTAYWRTSGHALAVLGLVGLVCCVAAFSRATYVLFLGTWFPAARYAYPAVVPLLLAVNGGWVTLINQASSTKLRRLGTGFIVAAFVALNALSLISIAQFYA